MSAQHKTVKPDPLLAGFYTHSVAARLLGISNQTLNGWLNGYPQSKSGPVILRDFRRESRTISFLDLMELRFVEHFRGQKVPMPTIRQSAMKAREDWDAMHPFALSKARYLTDRRNIFEQIAEKTGDDITRDLASGQHEMWEMIESYIAKSVVFDPSTHLAQRWTPKPSEFPNIILDPHFASGRPVHQKGGIPTSALFRQWKAEGHKNVVAQWFNIEASDVEEAIEFELSLAA